ncbi:hypothetical protein COOONC_17020 [Cooperia oncophora]
MVRFPNFRALLWAVILGYTVYLSVSEPSKTDPLKSCQSLRTFQYACEPPAINPETQQPLNCNVDNSVTVTCKVANGIQCRGLLNGTRYFHLSKPNACSYHAHVHHSTALLLSIFLGFLVLIALQLLQPADGSGFIINYYGPRVSPLRYLSFLNVFFFKKCDGITMLFLRTVQWSTNYSALQCITVYISRKGDTFVIVLISYYITYECVSNIFSSLLKFKLNHMIEQ